MRRHIVLFATLMLLASFPVHGAAPVAASSAATRRPAATGKAPAQFKNVTLHIFSRVFPNFHDKVVAVPNRVFRVGDTEYTARVIRFIPDFSLDLKTRKARLDEQRAEQPRLPDRRESGGRSARHVVGLLQHAAALQRPFATGVRGHAHRIPQPAGARQPGFAGPQDPAA